MPPHEPEFVRLMLRGEKRASRKPRPGAFYGLRAENITSEREYDFTPEAIHRLELRVESGNGDLQVRFRKTEAAIALRAGSNPLVLQPKGRAKSVFIAPLDSSTTFDLEAEIGPPA